MRFNRACEELTGFRADQVLGKPFWELPFLLDEDRSGMRERIAALTLLSEPTRSIACGSIAPAGGG